MGLINKIKQVLDNNDLIFSILDNESAAYKFNIKDVKNSTRVKLSDLEKYLWDSGVLLDIIQHGRQSVKGTEASRKAAAVFDRLLLGRLDDVDVNHTRFIAGMESLRSVELLTDVHVSEIIQLGIVYKSISEQNNLPDIKTGWVEMARSK